MNPPFHWSFVAIAALATVGALLSRADLSAAVPLAAIAVGASGVTLADAALRTPRAARIRPVQRREPTGGVRVLFREGRSGRESIILLLDRLERGGPHPDLPARPPAELRRIAALPPEEFRRTVAARLDELEKAP
jgi:hypothetical protein